MPGLCDAHLHLSWNNAPGIDPIQMMPPEEHTLVTAQMAKLVLDAGFTAGRGAAAAKPRLDVVVRNAINQRHDPRPALSRRRAGNHDRRRPRRLGALAHPARRPQSRHRRLRPRGGSAHRAHADQIRRRHDQAQSFWRRDHRDGGRRNADGRGRGGDGGARGEATQQDARRPMRARPARSSNACVTAYQTSITPLSPTKKRSTCWKRPRTGISSRRALPG